MLTLTRKIGERIFIGKEIEVMLVDVDRGRCRIGIVAPRHVPIAREEFGKPEERPVTTDVFLQLSRAESDLERAKLRIGELELALAHYREIEKQFRPQVERSGAALVGETH